jgi:hypothetical protein
MAFLLQAAADRLLQLEYFPPCQVQKGKYDTGFWCRVPTPDRAEAEGRQSSVCLAQEAPDMLSVPSSGGSEVFQALLVNDQLLHLPLHQLPLPGHQLSLLVSQSGIPGIHVELTGQDLGTDVLQSLLLSLEVGLTVVEARLAGAQGLELSSEGVVIQLLPLLQQPLQLFHLLLPLVDLVCTCNKLLLLLGDDAGPSLGRCVQLPRIGKVPPGVGVTLGDGLHLQVETMLPGPHCCPL